MKSINKEKADYKNITLFPGLNSLRFIAAFLVVMHHSETIKKKNGMDNLEWLGLFKNGGHAVDFFFVLSGFLITYLLLKENGNTGTISIKTFYFKRILRIWPLYFLLVFIGTIALPIAFSLLNITYTMPYTLEQTWLYFLLFMPGLVSFYFGHSILEPLWSIGVEEVFYLVWAPLFKFCKTKLHSLLVFIILIKLLLNIAGIVFIHNELYHYIIHLFKFEAMAIGGIGACILYSSSKPMSSFFIFKIPIQIAIFFILILYLIFHSNINHVFWNTIFKTPILSPILIYLFFLYTIICVSSVKNSIVTFNSKWLSFLGEISYGIYMYHMLVIFATMLFLKKYLIQFNAPFNHFIFYTVVAVITVFISIISKRFFENYFLNLKQKLL